MGRTSAQGDAQRLQRLDRAGDLTVVRLGEEHQREAGELARRWYRQRQPVLRVMYLFEENVWLFENCVTVTARVAGAFGVGVLRGGQLIAANLSCPLSDALWSCHTERYDNGALVLEPTGLPRGLPQWSTPP